jgi:hypothetical protein
MYMLHFALRLRLEQKEDQAEEAVRLRQQGHLRPHPHHGCPHFRHHAFDLLQVFNVTGLSLRS